VHVCVFNVCVHVCLCMCVCVCVCVCDQKDLCITADTHTHTHTRTHSHTHSKTNTHTRTRIHTHAPSIPPQESSHSDHSCSLPTSPGLPPLNCCCYCCFLQRCPSLQSNTGLTALELCVRWCSFMTTAASTAATTAAAAVVLHRQRCTRGITCKRTLSSKRVCFNEKQQGWPEPHTHAIYDCIFDDIPAKITVCIPNMHGSANPEKERSVQTVENIPHTEDSYW